MSEHTPTPWTKKRKGHAVIYTHPDSFEGRAVVDSRVGFCPGVTFNGKRYASVHDAKSAALSSHTEQEGK